MTPKQLGAELGLDPKYIRRHIRALFGTHHQPWNLTEDQVKKVKARIKKNGKKLNNGSRA